MKLSAYSPKTELTFSKLCKIKIMLGQLYAMQLLIKYRALLQALRFEKIFGKGSAELFVADILAK